MMVMIILVIIMMVMNIREMNKSYKGNGNSMCNYLVLCGLGLRVWLVWNCRCCARTHAHIHPPTHAQTYIGIHTHAHTYSHTHTDTHTRTHTVNSQLCGNDNRSWKDKSIPTPIQDNRESRCPCSNGNQQWTIYYMTAIN
jgi:ABC-type nickel/cobalt efflux system permease component RcnA